MNSLKEPFSYACSKDVNGVREYLVASTEEEIEVYCENGVLGHNKEILAWYGNPTPIMVAHHFKWVGKGKRPAILNISRPFKYGDPKQYKWTPS